MSWAWLALVSIDPVADDPVVAAPDLAAPDLAAPDLAAAAGPDRLLAWAAGPRPHPGAIRIDAAILAGDGAAATLVWQLFAAGRAPLFDDPAVQTLARRLGGGDLAGRRPDAVTTFTRDPVRYAGGLTVHRDARPPEAVARDSWLRRVGHVRTLSVGAGIIGSVAPRTGPGTQRYAGQPWPATGF